MLEYRLRGLMAAAMLACCAACTSGTMQPTIGNFATATGLAQANLNAREKSLDDAMVAYTTKVALTQPGLSARSDSDDCLTTSARCRLWVAVPGGRLPLTGTAGGEITELMDGILGYANDLAAIANANNGPALAAATDAASRSIIDLAGSIDGLAKAAKITMPGLHDNAAPLAQPLTQLVTIGLQQYSQARKFAALRSAVDAMQPVLEQAAPVFDAVAENGVRIDILAANDQYRAARAAYRASPQSADRLAALRRAAELYDVALQAKPTDLFEKLLAAHTAIATALRNPRPSFNAVWPILDQIVQEAAELAAAADKVETIKNS
jgi:hypothetical protein